MNRTVFRSLRSRLLLVLLGLTGLAALLIGGLAYHNARQTIELRVKARLDSVADLKTQQLVTWLDDRINDIHLLADNFLTEEHFTTILDPSADPERRQAFAGFLTDNLLSMQQARVGYSEIMFVDVAGRIILSTDPTRVGQDVSAEPVVGLTLTAPSGEAIEDM